MIRANYDAFVDGIRFDPDIKSFVLFLKEAGDTDSKDSETFAFIMEGKEPGDSEVTFSDGRQTTMAENIEAVINDYEVEYFIVVVGQAHLTYEIEVGPLQNFDYGSGVEIKFFDTIEAKSN